MGLQKRSTVLHPSAFEHNDGRFSRPIVLDVFHRRAYLRSLGDPGPILNLFVASQIFGSAALALSLVRFTRKTRTSLLRWALPSGVCNLASMVLNGQLQGAAIGVFSVAAPVLQSFLPARDDRWRRLFLAMGFAALAVWIEPPQRGQILTWLPLVGYLNTRLLVETRTDYLRMRLWWLLSTLCWLVYQMGEHNGVMALTEGLILVVGIRAVAQEVARRREPQASSGAPQTSDNC